MKFSKILTVVLLVSVLAISLIACSISKNNKDEKQSIDSSISTLMATEPNSADEASKLHNQLMEKENEILSTDKALWEKVFMASNKDNPMIEDGTNYGDFLLKTIEGAKDQFTDEEYKNSLPVQNKSRKLRANSQSWSKNILNVQMHLQTVTAFRLTATALFQTVVAQQVFRHSTARTLMATI
ncbi:MAG: hypothetical protein ACLTDT_08060 [Clostridium sp.]